MNRRTFLKNGLWVPFAPAILRAGVLPSSRRIATPLAASAYTAYSSVFDGTNDYMSRGADLTGNADGKLGILSLWYVNSGADGAQRNIFANSISKITVYIGTDNKLTIEGNDVNFTRLLIKTANTHVASANWHHLFATWNLATAGTGRIYIDGTSDYAETTYINNSVTYTGTDFKVGSNVIGGYKWNGQLCEVYLNLAEYLNDPTKFASGGKPISLGATGSLPTGTAPIVYLKNPYDSFGTNSGTGGNFTVTGALTQGTPP